MPQSVRYFVEITNCDGRYQGRIHNGDPAQAQSLPDLQLSPETTVRIKDVSYQLGDLVQALLAYQPADVQLAYDERGQLEIGRHLYAQLFSHLDAAELQRLREAHVDVRLITEDEHIAQLPWVLLNHNSVFLSTVGWSVALASTLDTNDCELPPSPRLLVVAPQPVDTPETRAEAHLEKLQDLLSGANHRHTWGRDLHRVSTWEDFIDAVSTFCPDIVYYYGHGIGDRHTSRLLFATRQGNQPVEKPVAEVALCLRQMPSSPPYLAYVNCCYGNAGGLLGAGFTLGQHLPAVITNRTLTYIDATQAQALQFWRSLLLDGLAPHRALATVRSKVVDLGLGFTDPRWMVPVLHCHYATWKANPPRPRDLSGRDPHWRLKLDRVDHFAKVFYLTTQMLQERRPRSLTYVWYGQPGQGVDLFHQRLTIELQEKLPDAFLYEVTPEWPVEFSTPYRSFAEVLSEAFEVPTLEDVPARIRTKTRGVSGRQTLVYVRHRPVLSSRVVNPRRLKEYVEWWDRHFVPLLEGQVFALLGVSFVVGKPDTFHRALVERERLPDLPLNVTVIQVLDEMGPVDKTDVLNFLRTHNIPIPPERRDTVIDEILSQTLGDYDKTLEALKIVADQGWDQAEQSLAEAAEPPDDDNYDI